MIAKRTEHSVSEAHIAGRLIKLEDTENQFVLDDCVQKDNGQNLLSEFLFCEYIACRHDDDATRPKLTK